MTAIRIFWRFLCLGMAIFGEDRLATLRNIDTGSAIIFNLFVILYHLVFFYCRCMAPISEESNLLRCTYGY